MKFLSFLFKKKKVPPRKFEDRPPVEKRLFKSEIIEKVIEEFTKEVKDKELQEIFRRCFPNTLDTTVYYYERNNVPYTYIITGDIPAMWIRDSVNQINPYLEFIEEDESLRKMVLGLINKLKEYIILDPYANAFYDPKISGVKKRGWGEGKYWKKDVWERKYELDSLGYFLKISYEYYERTKDIEAFDEKWLEAIRKILNVIQNEMLPLNKDNLDKMFKFIDPKGRIHPAVRILGYNYPGRGTGLIRTVFRPSDDEAIFPYNIPDNAFLSVYLDKVSKILKKIHENKISRRFKEISVKVRDTIFKYGVVEHEIFGKIFAYEVDGYGSVLLMDDPNIPSLLSLPYIGFVDNNDKIYRNTKEFIFSEYNPFYIKGKYFEGLGSPHTGFNKIWPMATIVKGLTSNDENEIKEVIEDIKKFGRINNYFMFESVNVDDPKDYTRPWFAWANSLVGDLLLRIYKKLFF